MLKFHARMLICAGIVLLAGVVGCATTETRKTNLDSTPNNPPARASCH